LRKVPLLCHPGVLTLYPANPPEAGCKALNNLCETMLSIFKASLVISTPLGFVPWGA